eukprot:1491147-Amphidinium_carterae.1
MMRTWSNSVIMNVTTLSSSSSGQMSPLTSLDEHSLVNHSYQAGLGMRVTHGFAVFNAVCGGCRLAARQRMRLTFRLAQHDEAPQSKFIEGSNVEELMTNNEHCGNRSANMC